MPKPSPSGPMAWMAKNHVAANLLMAMFLLGGLLTAGNIKQEVFPEFDLDVVQIAVPYPGASPEEVEQGVLLALEESVQGLDGVKEVTSQASESLGTLNIELLLGANGNKVLSEVKSAVDRITSLPKEAERPSVTLLTNQNHVISLIVYGEQSERVLRDLAEGMRSELLLDPSITRIDLSGVRAPEISIDVAEGNLRKYSLTLGMIAEQIRRAAIDLPGGGVKADSGEVLLRTTERRDRGEEFEDIVVLNSPEGGDVHVRDVATVIDGFEDSDRSLRYNGLPAAQLNVFRVGSETPIQVAEVVKAYVERAQVALPQGIKVATWSDRSEMYRDRMQLLLKNAYMGLFLVLFVLALFLEFRLAFWVTMGIPTSFLGAILLMPVLDVSLNMVSLFAFIITLGIVVDDAIVVAENVYDARQGGKSWAEAAIDGSREVAGPVVFSVLTTVAAFLPLFLIPGTSGKFFRVIPSIVVTVLLISLVESMFVLPAHLGHHTDSPKSRTGKIHRFHRRFQQSLQRLIDNVYGPSLHACIRARYLTMAVAVALLVASAGYLASGRLDFTFLPRVDSDVVTARIAMPFGVAAEETQKMRDEVVAGLDRAIAENGDPKMLRGVLSEVGAMTFGGGSHGQSISTGSNLADVQVYLVPSDQREVSASGLAAAWRSQLSGLVGVENLSFRYTTGPGGGEAINIRLSHQDIGVLEESAAAVAAQLATYPGVKDVDDGFSEGKPQLDFTMKPSAASYGLNATEIGRQVRDAFYGAEAIRQQRGRDEVKVMVRRPERERSSEFSIESLLVRTPDGGEVLLGDVARVERGRSYTQIRRAEGQRIVDVTADVVQGEGNAEKVLGVLSGDFLPALAARTPGLSFAFEGDRRSSNESLAALKAGYLLALVLIFALLAIPFRSYIQPLVVMSAIPFGMVGAIGGHVLMGYDFSIISIMGIVAASGIVVNDSLVLVHAANAFRHEEACSAERAVFLAGKRRFRPIMLTSLTTFFGLAPMILETSVQAKFLIPMAISLGFGVMFSTLVILVLVPALYLGVEDAKALFGRLFSAGRNEKRPATSDMT
jgi:multidrug efflux pump subunit AcrB